MSKVLVVTELVSIVSEKVTETFDVIETEVSSSEGELDETVGGVVSEELELLVDSSFSPQEMTVRLKQEIRKTYKNFFIFSSIPKVKYYCLCIREPNIYQNLGYFTRIGDFTWRLSDCVKN